MNPLTERQRETLEWIVAYIQTHWRPPAVEEVAVHFGIKRASAFDRIKALQKKGYIEHSDGSPRSLKPNNLAQASAAGIDKRLVELASTSESISAVNGFEGFIRVSIRHGRNRALFSVVIRGDSLIEAMIFDGDLAIVRAQEEAEDGDIALVSYGDELTLRRVFYGDDGTVLLSPENKKIEAVAVPEDAVNIHGKVVAIYRDLG